MIRLTTPVNREVTGPRLDLTVDAEDVGGRSAVATVRVIVQDVNDEAPVFERQMYETVVDETRTELMPPVTVRVSEQCAAL